MTPHRSVAHVQVVVVVVVGPKLAINFCPVEPSRRRVLSFIIIEQAESARNLCEWAKSTGIGCGRPPKTSNGY